jgi:cytochrome c peroxidase
MVRHVAPRATFRRYSRNQAGTCTKEIGIDDFQAKRGPDDRYVTAKLRALWDTKKIHKGGFYHDGRFATLADVVKHYDNHFQTRLTEQEKADLIEYLKSI